jgi:hypothetical protein
MSECLDEGILQSYFDGELSGKQMESATSHLAACPSCAAAARYLESEISLLASALAPEFEAAVPTERLRQRIDAAVAGLPLINQQAIEKNTATSGWLQSLASLFAFTPQRAFGYAGLAVVVAVGIVFGIIQRQQPSSPTPIAKLAAPPTDGPILKTGALGQGLPESITPPLVGTPVKSATPAPRTPSVKPRSTGENQAVAQVKLMPGERSYLKTIAALDSTIKAANSDKPMRPALRAEYERNLAVVNHALAATRSAAKKNPNDPDAKEFMFDAYQSKVDLLNTVADARSFNRQQ